MMAGALKLLPARWAIAILVAAIAYVLLQPKLNQWFGWNLPSAAAMLGQEAPTAKSNKPPINKPEVSNSAGTETPNSSGSNSGRTTPKTTNSQPDASANTKSDSTSSNKTASPKPSNPKPAPQKPKSPNAADSASSKTASSDSDDLKLRFLKPLGRDRYESPAGLIYAPGSEEGHRLKHLERHLSDQPNRPGSHGVFNGDMQSFLTAIDDGYKRARGHAKGTKQREEEGMTVFEAPFDNPVGYLGGSEGARKGKPKLKRLRIVVRDKNLITAFPIQ